MKENIGFNLLLIFALHFLSIPLQAQHHFSLRVQLPKNIDYQKVEAWLDDGKTDRQMKVKPNKEGRLLLSGEYYALFAAINIQYPPNEAVKQFFKTFFVGEKEAILTFRPSASESTPFKNYSLTNAKDFEAEKAELDRYTFAERKKASDYEARYGEQIFTGSDTAIRNPYFKVFMKELAEKSLDFVKSHPNSYFCFYTFRSALAKPANASPDTLLRVFNAVAERFRLSDEGNYLNQRLHAWLLAKNKMGEAIDFTTVDNDGEQVTLSGFRGKKIVLLHFWATWCSPCRQELPLIKAINEEYGGKGVQIISVALKSTDLAYQKTIRNYGMNWINVYNDVKLIRKYGNLPVPQLFLIDRDGNVVYVKEGLDNDAEPQLNRLKEKINELLLKDKAKRHQDM